MKKSTIVIWSPANTSTCNCLISCIPITCDISAPPSRQCVSQEKANRKLTAVWRQLSEILASAVYHRKVLMSSVANRVITGCCLLSPDSGNDDEDLPGLLMVRQGVLVSAQRSSKPPLQLRLVCLEAQREDTLNLYLLYSFMDSH